MTPVSRPSSIVPAGATLVNVRNHHAKFESIHLEVFEIVFGTLILAFIIGRQVQALRLRGKKPSKVGRSSPATAHPALLR